MDNSEIISEAEFENSSDSKSVSSGVRHLESHLTYRQNPSLKGSHPPDPVLTSDIVPEGPASDPVIRTDKINNIVQKEIAMARAGVSREKTYAVISRLLGAKKWAEVVDKQGNVKTEWVDDLDRQRQGAEMALKAMGDLIERKEIEVDMGDKTLDAYKRMSVAELKRRATELLLGKSAGPIVDAEVV